MGNNCVQQDCSLNCCDIDGYCPLEVKDCYYSYSSNAGIVAAIVIGSVLFVVCVVIVIYLILSRRRRRQQEQKEQKINQEGRQIVRRQKRKAECGEIDLQIQHEQQLQRRSEIANKQINQEKAGVDIESQRRLAAGEVYNTFQQHDIRMEQNGINKTIQ